MENEKMSPLRCQNLLPVDIFSPVAYCLADGIYFEQS
jgi:hypothetical protein